MSIGKEKKLIRILKGKKSRTAFILIFLSILLSGYYLLERYNIPSRFIPRALHVVKKMYLTLDPIVITDREIFESIGSSPLCPQTLKKPIHEENYQLAWDEYWKVRARHVTSRVIVDPATFLKTISLLKERYPGEVQKIISKADKYTADDISPFETGSAKLGREFSWTEFPSGDNDPIFIWEISTFQHFTILAEAYLLTGDKKYFDTVARHLDSWVAENPIENSINWGPKFEVAIRLYSLIWMGEMLCHVGEMKYFFPKLIRTIYAHARYVWEYLDRPRLRNNCGIIAAMGLYFFATNYPEFSESETWRSVAEKRILGELDLQYTTNGVQKEFAPTYHHLLLDQYLQYLVSKIKLNEPVPEETLQKIKSQLSFLLDITDSNKKVFLIADSDDHHFLRLGVDEYDCAGPTLYLGALLFSSKKYALASPGAEWEAHWILGYELYERLSKFLKAQQGLLHSNALSQIKAYRDEGFVRVKNGDVLLFCDFGHFGSEPFFMGHSHCDTSSFVLYKGGNAVVIDPGTYTYRRSLAHKGVTWRDFLRSSAAHNTTVVDGHSQARPIGDFGYDTWPEARLLVAKSEGDLFLIAGEHDAYQNIVGRAIRIFVISGCKIIVIDWFPESEGSHTYETNVIFKEKLGVMQGGRISFEDGSFYWMTHTGGDFHVLTGSYDPPGGWYSPSYGTLEKTPQFRGKRTIEGAAVIPFIIDLCNDGSSRSESMPLSIDSLPAGCFAIRSRSHESDITVLLNPAKDRSECPASYNGLMTDAFIALYEKRNGRVRTLMHSGTYLKSAD